MKKFVFIAVAMAMASTVLADTWTQPTTGINWTYEVQNGCVCIVDGADIVGDVAIPSTIAGYKVTSIGAFAFYGCTGLTSVTIPSSVTSIGNGAFYECTGLNTVYVSVGDTERIRRLLTESGSVDLDGVEFVENEDLTPTYTMIVGAKAPVDVGLKGQGYTTKTLPKGLTYSDKTGLVTGTCKTETAAEGVEVTFTKKNAGNIVLRFIARAENTPTIGCEGLDGTMLTLGITGGSAGIPIDLGSESGVKSVMATKLPTGMKIASSKDKTSWYITGAPTKAGTYEVAITLMTAAGNKVTEKFSVTVAALPSGATGTFNGFVQKPGSGEGETLNADGKTSVAGKLGTNKITASGYADVSGVGTGAIFADFAPVVTVGKDKKVLSLRANLWFDKSNNHEEGVGSAVFVP